MEHQVLHGPTGDGKLAYRIYGSTAGLAIACFAGFAHRVEMQRLPLYILGFLVLALGGFAIYERVQIGDLQFRLAAMEKTIAARDIFVKNAQAASVKIEKQNQAFIEESAALRKKLATPPTPTPSPTPKSAEAVAPPQKSSLGGMMDQMMKNPEMLDAIAAQQMTVLKPMYADLVKQLRLNPEETAEFYKLLGEQTSETMKAGMKLISGDKNAADEIKGTSDAMKTFLGDRYTQYQSYQKSVPDRAMLTQINAQMAARQTPLRPDQSAGLLQIMQQEPLNTAKFSAANTDPQNTAFDDKTIDDTYNAVADRNARVLARSKTLLTPEQWQAYAEQQAQTLQMQKMGMEMAKGMMGK